MYSIEQTRVSHAWLRRVCQRIPQVAPAHAGDPAISTQTPSLLSAAEAFASEADALASVEAKVETAKEDCAAKTQVLYERMRVWFPPLSRDVSGFVASAYPGTQVVVEDVISDGQAFVLRMREQAPRLPYGEQLIAELSDAIEALQTAYKALQTLRTERLERVKTEKRAARVLDQELIVFRHMLKRTVGTSHEHYRMLRMPRSTEAEPPEPPDDAAPEPATTEPSGPTTAGNGSSNDSRNASTE
jgi:hypothetical protein